LLTLDLFGVLSLVYGESMVKVVRFIRERTPFTLVVYGAYIYFVHVLLEWLQIF